MNYEPEMSREEKLKKLSIWRWELKLLEEDMATQGGRDIKEFDSVHNHANIVRALIRSAQSELSAVDDYPSGGHNA